MLNDNELVNDSVFVYLQEIGLTTTQANLYPFLIKLQKPITILEISQLSRIPRTTVHENIMDLITKGFVKIIKNGHRRAFIAEQPYVLKIFLEEQQIVIKRKFLHLKKLQSSIPRYISELETNT